jgi:hypothetical protein
MIHDRASSPRFQGTVARAALVLVLLAGCHSSSSPGNGESTSSGQTGLTIHAVALDENGALKEPAKLQTLLQESKDSGVTDVIVLAHGWNNSSTEAMNSYRDRAAKVQDQAKQNRALRPNPYKPLIIGLIWPSKMWDYGPAVEAAVAPILTADQLAALDASLPRSAAGSEEERKADFATLSRLAQKKKSDTTPQDRETALTLFRKYAIKPGDFKHPTPEDQGFFTTVAPAASSAPSAMSIFSSIGDAARVFTFWQMKQRAGIVGENGGAEVLKSVTAGLPSSRIHLFGHSFGCKLVLSAIKSFAKDRPDAKVDTVVLLQGAISFQAFADAVTGISPPTPGGYRDDLKAIKGPVVATYSAHDLPLREAYPLGARLAGQLGEVTAAIPSRYSALGAVGIFQENPILIKSPGQAYGFKNEQGLFSINGSAKIAGHSEISDPAVAWIEWAAMVRN